MAIQSQLTDMNLGQLLDAATHVRQLQGTPGWALLTGLVDTEFERVQTQLLSSSLPSHEKLAQLQGELRGLKRLRELAQTVLTEAQEREAEEQQRVGGS